MSNTIETTCTDCTDPILMDEVELGRRSKLSRLCGECTKRRAEHDIPPDHPCPPSLGNYCMLVELQWMITRDDLEYKAIGDVEVDFARRSLFKMREQLQLVAGSGHNLTPIGHYSLREESLRRCAGPAAEQDRAEGWVKRYHDALNNIATLAMNLERNLVEAGLLDDAVDFSQVATALAVGRRMGWDISGELSDLVEAAEDEHMPMGEAEAGRRMGI